MNNTKQDSSGLQEVISDYPFISLECFHTKIFTIDKTFETNLNNGKYLDQLKKIHFVHGHFPVVVYGEFPKPYNKLEFKNIGDSVLLSWNGTFWIPLETINILLPSSNSPIFQE
jgi:hypothetical protein